VYPVPTHRQVIEDDERAGTLMGYHIAARSGVAGGAELFERERCLRSGSLLPAAIIRTMPGLIPSPAETSAAELLRKQFGSSCYAAHAPLCGNPSGACALIVLNHLSMRWALDTSHPTAISAIAKVLLSASVMSLGPIAMVLTIFFTSLRSRVHPSVARTCGSCRIANRPG